MQTIRLPGSLALGDGKTFHSSGPRFFLWTELKTCREGGLNSLQSSAVGNQLMLAKGEKKGRKKHLAQRFSQAPVSMGTSSPGVVMSDSNSCLSGSGSPLYCPVDLLLSADPPALTSHLYPSQLLWCYDGRVFSPETVQALLLSDSDGSMCSVGRMISPVHPGELVSPPVPVLGEPQYFPRPPFPFGCHYPN
ncbi:hypothetical protein GBF38_003902 [Nibea albiflora]|uniref:Uncharacterized protein n=1 Tax=Nibea albiflora TaxID=240163 RepID=A0ACB7FCA7_NIBAL|nr:hypothetical protein GBF38_003902 [Nibea albiflora]